MLFQDGLVGVVPDGVEVAVEPGLAVARPNGRSALIRRDRNLWLESRRPRQE